MGKQEFLAVQCFSCSAFQVQLSKQSNKFNCSVCQAKQSIQRVYARSNLAKDVRQVVQAYNTARSTAETEADQADWQAEEEWDVGAADLQAASRGNKWAAFAEDDDVAWTVALPEQAGNAARPPGAKRKRVQQEHVQPEDCWDQEQPAAESSKACSRQQPPAPRQALAQVNHEPILEAYPPSRQAAVVPQQRLPGCAAPVAAAGTDQRPAVQQPGTGKWATFLSEDD